MKKILVFAAIIFSFLSVSVFTLPSKASAAVARGCNTSFLGLPTWYKYLDVGPGGNPPVCEIQGPGEKLRDSDGKEYVKINWQAAAGYVGLAVLEAMLSIATLVAVAFVIYGGFKYITSQGDPEGAKNARQAIINAVIGLVVALVSAGVVRFVAGSLTG